MLLDRLEECSSAQCASPLQFRLASTRSWLSEMSKVEDIPPVRAGGRSWNWKNSKLFESKIFFFTKFHGAEHQEVILQILSQMSTHDVSFHAVIFKLNDLFQENNLKTELNWHSVYDSLKRGKKLISLKPQLVKHPVKCHHCQNNIFWACHSTAATLSHFLESNNNNKKSIANLYKPLSVISMYLKSAGAKDLFESGTLPCRHLWSGRSGLLSCLIHDAAQASGGYFLCFGVWLLLGSGPPHPDILTCLHFLFLFPSLPSFPVLLPLLLLLSPPPPPRP